MMLANITIGDTSVSVYRVDPIRKDAKAVYELHFVDLPTRVREFIQTDSEDQALKLFAAWIAIDMPDLGSLNDHRADLASNLTEEFLP